MPKFTLYLSERLSWGRAEKEGGMEGFNGLVQRTSNLGASIIEERCAEDGGGGGRGGGAETTRDFATI
jgi:hypothetical protein